MTVDSGFDAFLNVYPPDPIHRLSVDGERLADAIHQELHVQVPSLLVKFWNAVGCGYFGIKQLYFFSDGLLPAPRDSLLEWNQKEFWREIFPTAREGGAVWFAETAFGDQLGYRYAQPTVVEVVLFVIDTFNVYTVAQSFETLFGSILTKRNALVESDFADQLLRELGPPPDGMHYAPIVSPLVGGSAQLSNIHFETANVHVRTTVATFQTLQGE